MQPHAQKFRDIYGPIRHKYFAHRSTVAEEVIAELFSKTNVKEVSDTLKSVYDLLRGVQDLAMNGTLPGQWHAGHYDTLYREYEASAERFIQQLPASRASA